MSKPATMLVVFLLFFLCAIPFIESKIYLEDSKHNENLQECICDIMKTYFYQYKELSYVDMDSHNQEIIKTINSISTLAIISKTTKIQLTVPNESYLITAGNINNFTNSFSKLLKEASWNPSARFLILVENLLKENLKTIFDVLLECHVINVVVIDESNCKLYTYNPFENYGCGRHYERIINFGKCSDSRNKDLYPYKLVTGLKNCTFKVNSPHWPPYSMDPMRNDIKLPGVEEYVFKEISALEHFSLNFSYSDNAEIFTMTMTNNSVVGPLFSLQKGEVDVVLGGMFLTHPRAKVFNYIYGHLAYADDLRYQVKKATAVSPWKNMYMEFNVVVWIALLLSFVIYFIFFIVLVRPKDIGQVCLNMLAFMFLNGRKIKGNCITKYLFVSWIWFTYLINSYYQSSLVSLTMNPYFDHQISDEMDITAYHIKPCVSEAIRDFLSAEDYYFEANEYKGCNKLLECMNTVGRSNDKFTVTIHSTYTYNKHSFYDEIGNSMIYTFTQPFSNIIYAIYLYKGFPLVENVYIHTLRLRENGLIDKYLRLLYWRNNQKYIFNENVRKPYNNMPWCILICGYTLSFAVFILEILIKRHIDRKILFHQ